MDIHQEDVVMNKGKRTKRQRTTSMPSAFVLTMGGTSSCSSGGGAGLFLDVSGGYSDHRFTASSSDSGELAQSSVEEEDMANCLILLARGSGGSQKAAAAVTAEVYQCKTCERCFPSFQALGGHRASHKKPPKAVNYSGEKKQEKSSIIRVVNYSDNSSTALSLQIPGRESGKSRVHECSICGAEFSSGQALGGHMRRHRPLPTAATATAAASSSSTTEDAASQEAVKKKRTLLSLDLNLDPAPEPEEYDALTSKQDTNVFTASPLVDCHY